MAPCRTPLRFAGAAACVAAALSVVDASRTVTNVISASASASASGSVKTHRANIAATSETFQASSQTLARGSMARNVQAAQYDLAANKGFFSWWPSFGWRSFLGWWGSKGTGAIAASSTGDLDKVVETTNSKAAKPLRDAPAVLRSFARGHEDVDGGTISGFAESLDEYGYQLVAQSKSEGAMMQFMKRTMVKEGLRVVDEETMYEVVKFYDGECATQSYRNLVEELHRAEHPYLCHVAWTGKTGEHASTSDASLAALALLGTSAPSEQPEAAGLQYQVGGVAALNEHGYQQVANTRNRSETMVFIKRVLDSLHLKVTYRPGLYHFAPYYSGECARQSFTRLVTELREAPTRPTSCGGGWVGDAGGWVGDA